MSATETDSMIEKLRIATGHQFWTASGGNYTAYKVRNPALQHVRLDYRSEADILGGKLAVIAVNGRGDVSVQKNTPNIDADSYVQGYIDFVSIPANSIDLEKLDAEVTRAQRGGVTPGGPR